MEFVAGAVSQLVADGLPYYACTATYRLPCIQGRLLRRPLPHTWAVEGSNTMSSVINRRPTGTPAGGQFAPKQYGEPALALGQSIDSAFEAEQGKETLRQLQALPSAPLRGAAAASKYSDLLRESYGSYFADGEAEADRGTAVESLRQALSDLPPARRDEYVALIGFAVHTEMKHNDNPEYLLSLDHEYEQLVDLVNYPDLDEDPESATTDNREAWALLADNAAAAALAEAAEHSSVLHAA